MSELFNATFSHEFEDGRSGPARSYWDFSRAGGITLGSVCLHPREINAELTANNIVHMLERAYEMGRASKQDEIRAALGIRR